MSALRAPCATAILAVVLAAVATAQQCGSQAGGTTCANCLCCSQFGFCGSTSNYCGAGCQSQCSGCGSSGGGVASIVSRHLFERFLLHRNDAACLARGFYTRTTPSWPLPARSRLSAPPETWTRGSGRWRPSSARLLTRPPVGGLPRPMAPSHGATASSRSRARHRATATRAPTSCARPASITMAAAPSSSPTTTTTDRRDARSGWTC